MKIFKNPYFSFLLSLMILITSCTSNYETSDEILPTSKNNNLLTNKVSDFGDFTNIDYNNMLYSLKGKIDSILLESLPEGISLDEYKLKLLNGELELSESNYNKILEASTQLSNYGRYLAEKNDIDIEISDISSTISLGGLYSPSDDLETKYYGFDPNSTNAASKLGPSDFLTCAAVAVGADALWALGGSSASAWTAAAMTRAFSAVAKRFLGPVGVAIAVVSFGVCLAERA